MPRAARPRSGEPWTEREDALICRLRAQDESKQAIADRLPHRTFDAVSQRIVWLIAQGRIERQLEAWTEREDALICRLRARDKSLQEITDRLPGRSFDAVNHRVSFLADQGRLARRWELWTAEEDALLCRLKADPQVKLADIVRQLPERTSQAITQRISVLVGEGRIAQSPTDIRRPWTPREDRLLVQLREQDDTAAQMAERLPHRTPKAIARRLGELAEAGLVEKLGPRSRKPWSAEDDRLLQQMLGQRTMVEIARVLGRTRPSINGRIAQLRKSGYLPL